MSDGLKFKPGLVFAAIFGCFLAFYITANPCYAAARATVSLLDQVPAKAWMINSGTELAAAYYGVSLEVIDYIKQPYVYTALSSPITTPSPIATSYFLNSVDQKMDPATASEVIGGMKAMSKVLKYSKPWWMNSPKGLEWYVKRSAAIYAKINKVKP